MKAVFVHDHKFKQNKSIFYSNGGITDVVLSFYTSIFDNIDFFARIEKSDSVSNMSSVTNDNVLLFDGFRNQKSLIEKIKENNCIILRLPSMLGELAAFCARRNNKLYLVEMVGCPWDSYWNHSFKGKIVAPIMWFLTRVATKMQLMLYMFRKTFCKRDTRRTGKFSLVPMFRLRKQVNPC